MSLVTRAKQLISRRPAYQRLRRDREIRKLRDRIRATNPLRIVIGSGETAFAGWIATDRYVLDIAQPRDWEQLFEPDSIDFLLSEHVLEHLSEADCRIALGQCYRYLKPQGLFRLAVPDGYRRDPDYVAEVSPPKDGHQMLFTVDNLKPMLEDAGFCATPLEYFDSSESFHAREWDEQDGFIKRSRRFDDQIAFKRGDMYYTSLIIDARKGAQCAE
jgi:predicted SAM-dependent methyltransferase